jgi:hypothetical protein
MDPEERRESLMEATGMGLLPGLSTAMTVVVLAMAALLTGSVWVVAGALALIGLSVMAIVFVVVAVTTEGEPGRRLRAMVPGLSERTFTEN